MKRVLLVLGLAFAACKESPPTVNKPAEPTSNAQATTAANPAAASATAEPPLIPSGTKMKCPVTGEDFTVNSATVQVVYKGKRYAFCCADCQPDFMKNPDKYAGKNQL